MCSVSSYIYSERTSSGTKTEVELKHLILSEEDLYIGVTAVKLWSIVNINSWDFGNPRHKNTNSTKASIIMP